jgi:hypothetical protein
MLLRLGIALVMVGCVGCVSSMAGTNSQDSLWVVGVHNLIIPAAELPKLESEALKGSSVPHLGCIVITSLSAWILRRVCSGHRLRQRTLTRWANTTSASSGAMTLIRGTDSGQDFG